MQIASSILSADFGDITNEVKKVDAKIVHIDVMDGHFVPNLSFGPQIVSSLRKLKNVTLEVHLMAERPENWIPIFKDVGADCLIVHAESTQHIHRALNLINKSNLIAGVAINPGTTVESLESVLSIVDQVLVMTVDPGFGGQKLIPEMLQKVDKLVKLRDEHKDYHYSIEIDGGVNSNNIVSVFRHHVDISVVGSALYDGGNATENLDRLREIIGN